MTGRALLVIATLSLLAPAGAAASTATVTGEVLTVTVNPGEANQISFSASGTDSRGALVQIRDAGSLDTIPNSSTKRMVGAGECDQDSTGRAALCPVDNLTRVVVDLGDGNDRYDGAGMQVDTTLTLGTGNDFGSTERGASDTLAGGEGDDTLETIGSGPSSSQEDTFDGGSGNDMLIVGRSSGADTVRGGPDVDTVSYATRAFTTSGTAGVTVNLDDVANDGSSTEGDNVATDVENVIGTSRGDKLTGSPAGNVLDGRSGGDSIRGAGGADTLVAGPGTDQLDGGDGTDTLKSRDGLSETVLCGPRFDVAEVDLEDKPRDCEFVDTSPADDGPPSHAAGRRLALGAVRIVCPSDALVPCRGRVRVGPVGGRAFFTGAYDVPLGATRRVPLDLTSKQRGRLRKLGEALVTTREQGRSSKGKRSSRRILKVRRR